MEQVKAKIPEEVKDELTGKARKKALIKTVCAAGAAVGIAFVSYRCGWRNGVVTAGQYVTMEVLGAFGQENGGKIIRGVNEYGEKLAKMNSKK